MANPPEPTLDDLRDIAHADTLPLLERGDPGVRAALEAQWRAATSPPANTESEEQRKSREGLEAYHKIVGAVPPEPTIGEILNLKTPKPAEPEPSADTAPEPDTSKGDMATLRELAEEGARQQRDMSAALGNALRPRRDPPPESPHSLASIIMNGFPEVRRREEEELLRKREELIAREEKLQQAASTRRVLDATQPTAPKDTIDWNEVVADEKAARNSETVRSNSEPQQPRTQKVSRVMAGGLFALFLGSIIQALQLFGLIGAVAGHVFMLIALVAGILIITTEILPLKPARHKVAAIILLVVLLGAIDLAASLYANKRGAAKASSGTSPASQSTPEELQDNVFLSDKYEPVGKTKTFTFLGDKNYGAVSFQARFGVSGNVMIILLVHSTEVDPKRAAGDCLSAINNYQTIVDELKEEIRKSGSEYIDVDADRHLVCHDYATDIHPEKFEALKRIASGKGLVLSVEGPRGPQ